MRKNKKADVTQTVINRLANELNVAAENGLSADDVLGEMVLRNWQGFKFEWMQSNTNNRPAPFQSNHQLFEDSFKNNKWAENLDEVL